MSRAEPAVQAHRPPQKNIERRALLRAAAVIGPVALGGAGFVVWSQPASAATGVGEHSRVAAARGLVIELNTDTRVRWKVRGRTAEVWLDRGEAAVFIDPNVLESVEMHCAARTLLLTPGAYNVRGADVGAEVLVLEGGAKIQAAAARPAIEGQAIQIRANEAVVRVAEPDHAQAAVAWRKGEVIFDGQTLQQAVRDYNRYLARKLVVAPDVATLRIGGRFETAGPAGFLSSLDSAFGIEAVERDGDILLKRKSAGE